MMLVANRTSRIDISTYVWYNKYEVVFDVLPTSTITLTY